MNLYLFEIIVKFLRMLFIAFVSIFNISLYREKENLSQNSIINQEKYAINEITIVEEKPVVKEIQKTSSTIVDEQPIVQSDNVIETFTGRLTGYGPDCPGCSSVGNVACVTKDKKTFSLISDGVFYNDDTYGKVRILAAATTKFGCGTIINVTKEGRLLFTAIVLDTGGTMRKAWSNGTVWMDLAFESEAMATNDLTGYNIQFDVLRYGW